MGIQALHPLIAWNKTLQPATLCFHRKTDLELSLQDGHTEGRRTPAEEKLLSISDLNTAPFSSPRSKIGIPWDITARGWHGYFTADLSSYLVEQAGQKRVSHLWDHRHFMGLEGANAGCFIGISENLLQICIPLSYKEQRREAIWRDKYKNISELHVTYFEAQSNLFSLRYKKPWRNSHHLKMKNSVLSCSWSSVTF